MKTISITTGDKRSVGLEITTKALHRFSNSGLKNFCIFIWRSCDSDDKYFSTLKKKFSYKRINSLSEAFKAKKEGYLLVDIKSSLTEYEWVKLSVREALKQKIDAIVTGPLTKNKKYKGHTDLLKKLTNKELFMCFVGSKFSVLLMTDHISLKEVSRNITLEKLKSAIGYSHKLLKLTGGRGDKGKVGLLGLNPHAGENGTLGSEELDIYKKAIKWASTSGLSVEGPLASDTAFRSDVMKNYKVFIANYHDQGLIPFKSLHKPHSTVNITLGLPFVRTSCDHGLGVDIAGKNMANDTSMYQAIKMALNLA